MDISGKIVRVLPEKSGQSSRGGWRKQEYILEIPGKFPKQLCFMAWGDKIDEFGIREGQDLQVFIDIESREYNDRWYTDVKAWKVAAAGVAGGNDMPPPVNNDFPPDDDVPF